MSSSISSDEVRHFLINRNLDALALLLVTKNRSYKEIKEIAKLCMADSPAHLKTIKNALQDLGDDVNPLLHIQPTVEEIFARCSAENREILQNLINRVKKYKRSSSINFHKNL